MAHSNTPAQSSDTAHDGRRTTAKRLFRVAFTLSVFVGMMGWYLSEIIWGFPRWPSIFTGCAFMVVAYLLLLSGIAGFMQLSKKP